MGEVLSQSEIDSLLAALSSGELDVDCCQPICRFISEKMYR